MKNGVSIGHAILIAIFCAGLGIILGFVMGRTLERKTHTCAKHSIGYTVLTSSTVVTCCNEVVKYNWQQHP